MIKIGILGYSGRMGSLIAADILARDACELAGGLVRAMPTKTSPDVFLTTDADALFAKSDVVIDFTVAEAVKDNLQLAVKHGKAFVCGVTGLDADTQKALKDASTKIPVLYAANTSLSLAAMKRVISLASKLLSGFDYDIAIHDEHHRMKKDAPSGTAKALGDAVLEGNSATKKPEYSAVRAGYIVGEHEVIFAGAGEMLRLRHSVTDRRIFAQGAVEAALWLTGKPKGLYGIDDVLGITVKNAG